MASGETGSGPPGRGRIWIRRLLLWVGIPLAILSGIERGARRLAATSEARMQWFEGASDELAGGGVDFLFLGTSRTASGFLPWAWEDEIEKTTNRQVVCLNLGRAFSGPVASYFGLRELLRRHPERMRRCTVLIEMSGDLPAFTAGWDDPWFFEGNTQLIVDYMRREDLQRVLRTRQHRFEDKAGVVARYIGRGSALVSNRRRIQQAIEWHGLQLARSVMIRLGATTTSTAGIDLPQNRQLRVDAGGIRLQRELVQERTRPEELAAQKPYAPWEGRVIGDVVAELRRSGVRVVFHEIPVPAYVWTVNSTPTRMADRETFDRWTRELGILRLRSGIEVTDADFPDLSHLRASRIEEYTRALARSWLAEEGRSAR
jgi:hypothetical protein